MENKLYTCAIIPAAGHGKRMGTSTPKQYLMLEGKPLLVHTIQKFEACSMVDEIIVVTGEDEVQYCEECIIKPYQLHKVIKIVAGGRERQHSVYNGLKEVNEKVDIVMIHDGARPFISTIDIQKSIEGAKVYQACGVGVPVKDTIKICNDDGFIINTPKRSELWSIQTPQSFQHSVLKEAYERAWEDNVIGTDDAMLVERIGIPVKIVQGSYENIKITTPEDLLWGEILIKKSIRYLKENNE